MYLQKEMSLKIQCNSSCVFLTININKKNKAFLNNRPIVQQEYQNENLKVGVEECGYYARLLSTKFCLKNKTLTLGCRDCICFHIVTPSGKRKNRLTIFHINKYYVLEYYVSRRVNLACYAVLCASDMTSDACYQNCQISWQPLDYRP